MFGVAPSPFPESSRLACATHTPPRIPASWSAQFLTGPIVAPMVFRNALATRVDRRSVTSRARSPFLAIRRESILPGSLGPPISFSCGRAKASAISEKKSIAGIYRMPTAKVANQARILDAPSAFWLQIQARPK